MSETPLKKYVVRLSVEARQALESLIGKGRHPAGQLHKARIPLKANISDAGEGWSDQRIVAALDTSLTTIHRTRRWLVEKDFAAALRRKPREHPSIPRIFDGEAEAWPITLACSAPPAGRTKWTLLMLEQKVVELQIVARATSHTNRPRL